ncbi:Ig-like domain-containing protein [Pontibacter vulgaris]|uniref:Ig-like domain-containing protein n=1 Tax=Pontibacter vulgaris TaxID=2905679 RepID=UPI001FA71352|nr:Ig-like domain-containing protein [Pontibacter vulgaris]
MKKYFAVLGMTLLFSAGLTTSATPIHRDLAVAEHSAVNSTNNNPEAFIFSSVAAPAVTLTSPKIGAVLDQNSAITLTADASNESGSISKVEFYANNAKVGEDNTSPYSVSWSAASAGDFTLTAKAYDNSGASTTSSPVKISVLEWGQKIVRILPLGNSITFDSRTDDTRNDGDKRSYRYKLSQQLKQAGYSVDFVGSRYSGYNFFADANNGGIPGIRDDQVARMLATGFNARDGVQETPGPYLESYPADIILLHIGTNQVNESPADVESILNEIDKYEASSKTSITVILAQIINRVSGAEKEITSAFNRNIKAMAEARIAKGDKIVIVDMEKGAGFVYELEPNGDMADNLHPNTVGYDKMANVWFAALKNVLGKPTGISDPNSSENLADLSVFPNPFQNELNIMLKGIQNSAAELELYDMNGRRVAELFKGDLTPGQTIELKYNTSGLASGMYFAKLKTEKGMLTRKLVLQR